MFQEEKKATAELTKKANSIKRAAANFKFDKALILINESIELAKACTRLSNADPGEYGGSAEEYASDYLRRTKTPVVSAKLKEEGSRFECTCDNEDGCECLEDSATSQIQGLRCHFCDDSLPRGTEFHILKKTNEKICIDCFEFFRSAAFPEDSAMRAIEALIDDFKLEIREPYFQYKIALGFLERARERCLLAAGR